MSSLEQKLPKKEFAEDEFDPEIKRKLIQKQRALRQQQYLAKRQRQKTGEKMGQPRQTKEEKEAEQKKQEEEEKIRLEQQAFSEDTRDALQKIFDVGYPLIDDLRLQNELTLYNLQNFSAQLIELVKNCTLQDCYKIGTFYLNAYQSFLKNYNSGQVYFNDVFEIQKNKDIFKALTLIMSKLSGSRLSFQLGDVLYKFSELQKEKIDTAEAKEQVSQYFQVQKIQQEQSYCHGNFKENFYKRENERNTIAGSFMKNGIDKGVQSLLKTFHGNGIYTFEEFSKSLETISPDLKSAFSDIFEELYDEIDHYDSSEEKNNQEEEENEDENNKNNNEDGDDATQSQADRKEELEKNKQKRQKKVLSHQQKENKKVILNLDSENRIDQNSTTDLPSDIESKPQQFAKDLINLLLAFAPQTNFQIVITKDIIDNLKLKDIHLTDAVEVENKKLPGGIAGLKQKYRILNCLEVVHDLNKFQKLCLQLSLITVDNLQHLSQSHKYLRNKFFLCLVRFYLLFGEVKVNGAEPWLYLFQLFWEVIGPRLRVFKEDIREIKYFLHHVEKTHFEFFEFLMQFEELESIWAKKEGHKDVLYFNNVQVYNAQPIQKNIPAGKSGVIYRVFEVFKPLSLISFSFSVEQKDVSFAIKYLGGFQTLTEQQKIEYKDGVVIVKGDKVKCDVDPYKGNLLAVKQGLYVAEFSNQYSWFSEKKLEFRLSILEPVINDFNDNNFSLPIRKVLYPNFYEKNTKEERLKPFLFEGMFNQTLNKVILYLGKEFFGLLVTNPEEMQEVWEEEIDVQAEFLGKVYDKVIEIIEQQIKDSEKAPIEMLIIKSIALDKHEECTAKKLQEKLKTKLNHIKVKQRVENDIHLRFFYQFLLHNRMNKDTINYAFIFNEKQILHIEKLIDMKVTVLNDTTLCDEDNEFKTIDEIIEQTQKLEKLKKSEKIEKMQEYFSQLLINIMLANLEENIKLYFINFDQSPLFSKNFEKVFKKIFRNVIGEYQARNFIKLVPNVEIVRLHFDIKLDQLI